MRSKRSGAREAQGSSAAGEGAREHDVVALVEGTGLVHVQRFVADPAEKVTASNDLSAEASS